MIRRSYRCDTCDHAFEHVCEKNDPDPDCPVCAYLATRDVAAEVEKDRARMQEIIDSGRAPAVVGIKSKAMDYAQRMAEEDYGLTNMRDNAREGENHVIPETLSKDHKDAIEQAKAVMAASAMAPNVTPASGPIQAISHSADPTQIFFGGNGCAQGQTPPAGAPNIAAAAGHARAARANGDDPVAKLHAAGKQGLLADQHQVVGRAPIPAGA